MEPIVIHIKDAPLGWEDDPHFVYIGRPGGKHPHAKWGNPYPIGQICKRCGQYHGTGGSTLACFEAYAQEAALPVNMLTGRVLVCFCKPNPCHGDVLVKLWREHNERVIPQ